MVCFYNNLTGIRIGNGFCDITSGNTLLQALNGFLAIRECLDLHERNLLAFAAVYLTDNQILRYVNQTTGQVTGVRCTQSRIGQTFTGTVSRDEVLQYVQTFTEVGLNRQLDGVTGCIGHQSSHTCQLFDLLIRTSSSGVSHHVDVVVLIQAGQQVMGQLIIRCLPGFNNLFITLLLGNQTAAVVLCNPVYGSLCLSNQSRLGLRHRHIRNRYRHGCSGRIFVTNSLNIIQGYSSLSSAMYINNLLQNLLQLFLSYMEVYLKKQFISFHASVYKSQILRNDFIENETSHGRFYNSAVNCAVGHGLGHTGLDSGMQGNNSVFVSKNCLVYALEDLALTLCTRALLGQVVDTKNHILGRNRYRAAVRRLQQVVRRKQQETALCLSLYGQGQMHSHLVTVEVRIERGTY